MKKEVIRQTKDMIGIIPADRFNQYVYENELKLIRFLLCECSEGFLDWLRDANQKEIAECLYTELKEDKQTIYVN